MGHRHDPGRRGNWGGSFLTVPKQSKHQKEAAELAGVPDRAGAGSWIFRTQGHLPSRPALYDDPAVSDTPDPFFNNAPTGQIFAASAKNRSRSTKVPRTATSVR